MSTIVDVSDTPTRAELRTALYEHHEAEKAWRDHMTETWSSLLNNTPQPGTDVVELHAACGAAWRRLIDIADRLPEGGAA